MSDDGFGTRNGHLEKKNMQKTSKKHEKMTEKTLLVVETIQEVASPRIYFFGPRNLRHLWIACYPTWRSGDGERGEPRIPGLHPGWLKATPAIYPRA